jgi:outer membrane murein-binding lipoprotein Lpp
MRHMLAWLGLSVLLLAGCTQSDQSEIGTSGEVSRLEAQNAVLEAQLGQARDEIEAQGVEQEDAKRIADIAESGDCSLREEQLERLIQYEHLLYGDPSAKVNAPGTLFIPTHGYRTIEPQITIEVMVEEGSTVTIAGTEAAEVTSYAGGFIRHAAEVNLGVGSNMISVLATSPDSNVVELPMVVYHDPYLEQRYGFVVSTPIEADGPSWQVGIDYIDIELGGEFGNSYDNPTVDVEVLPVSAGALAFVRDGATGFGIYSEELLVLTGPEIRDLFYGFHGHPERLDGDPHTWVFSLLLDHGEVVQFEPIPIGS